MPCRYYTDAEERQMALEAAQNSEETITEMQEDLELLTRVACDLAGSLPVSKINELSSETVEWVVNHAKMDRSTRSSLQVSGSMKAEDISAMASSISLEMEKERKRSSKKTKGRGRA